MVFGVTLMLKDTVQIFNLCSPLRSQPLHLVLNWKKKKRKSNQEERLSGLDLR